MRRDDIPPTLTLTLIGDATITHERGYDFIEPGAGVFDLSGSENLTSDIVVTVDWM